MTTYRVDYPLGGHKTITGRLMLIDLRPSRQAGEADLALVIADPDGDTNALWQLDPRALVRDEATGAVVYSPRDPEVMAAGVLAPASEQWLAANPDWPGRVLQ